MALEKILGLNFAPFFGLIYGGVFWFGLMGSKTNKEHHMKEGEKLS
jgi:hypothetical protein